MIVNGYETEPGANLTGADLTRADLTRADLTEADLTRAYLTRADLTEADLTRAYLTRANLLEADLRGANLHGADLTRADLTRANLTGADLLEADLRGANLHGAYLTRADLTRANLTGADLTEAYLTGANLHGANLTRANLLEANLHGANLHGANLTGANLTGADLTEADLTGADGAICLGYDPRGYRFVGIAHHDGWRILAGCRWFTLDRAREHWAKNPDALARVAILDAHDVAAEVKTMYVDYKLDIQDLPRECIEDCSQPGPADEAVEYWVGKLGFTVNPDRARTCLRGYGAWGDGELSDDDANARRILWLACGAFREYLIAKDRGELDEDGCAACGSDIFVLE